MCVLILSTKILIIFQWVYILICIDINSIEDINLHFEPNRSHWKCS